MPMQDTSEIKSKMINFLKLNGPSLPIRIAKEVGLSTLFASAFLSELLSERQLKMSYMKVGSSKLHFIEGQENQLEPFADQFLKSKEKEAFVILKEKKFLRDSEQHPAIRVALREINDFAVSFNSNGEIFWRYFLVPESEFYPKVEAKEEVIVEEPVKKEKEIVEEINEEVQDTMNIFDKEEPEENSEREVEIEKPKRKLSKKKSSSQKKNDQFFNKVKDYLSIKSIEIVDIESFNKTDLSLRVKQGENFELIVAYNKRKIAESDIIKASKKAEELNLPYTVLSLGEPLKKMTSFIDAVKNLSGIEKIE
jgi:hypothetical protein